MGDISAAHSKLGASSYSRWKACPGSVQESEGLENVESEYAKEGTLAHSIGERLLHGENISDEELQSLPDDMVEAVNVYVDVIEGYENKYRQLWIEKKFDLTKYHPKFFGTADAVLYHTELKQLVVVDYKHGKGVPVEITDKDGNPNAQLMYYALGALHVLALPVSSVELVIVQPRCYHEDGPVRSITIRPTEVIDYVADLIADAKKTETENPPLVSGSHCRWCPAKEIDPALGVVRCREIRNKPAEMMKSPFQAIQGYDPAQLSALLEKLPLMEDYIKTVREFAYREATDGRVPPGFKLVDKIARRKWIDESKAEFFLTQETDLAEKDLFDRKFKSVAQIETVVGKKNFQTFSHLTEQRSSGKSLVIATDKRKEVTGASSPFTELEK